MYVCQKCGSDKVQVKEWVEVNSGQNMGAVDGSGNEPEDNWCPECDDHCIIIDGENKN